MNSSNKKFSVRSTWHIIWTFEQPALNLIFNDFFFKKNELTTRWRQDHIRVFWIGCNLCNPSTVTQKGTTSLKCFSHFFISIKDFFLKIHVCSPLRAKRKRTPLALVVGEFAIDPNIYIVDIWIRFIVTRYEIPNRHFSSMRNRFAASTTTTIGQYSMECLT